ncbi:MAG TPA: hypothetical protein VL485_10755 [Ktedonobacteraceae bacterium]|jgi:hypothetical protein|nr:hypothetical protein [Ktedonobacteraceae bacterium]
MDLWSEFDNNLQLSPEPAVHGRTRRLTERVILSLVREWLLQDYVSAYSRSLAATHIFKRCYWLDALGLDGRSTKIVQAADPVEPALTSTRKGRKKIAAPVPPALEPVMKLANALAQESKPIALYGLLFEAGSSRRRAPQIMQNGAQPASGKELVVPRESSILRTNWLDAASVVLKEIEAAPAIFLLNPFGATLFSAEELAQLYQRTVPSELCLLVPHKQLEQHLKSAFHTPELGARLTSLLRSDRWKMLSIKDEELVASLEKLLVLFTAAMQRHFQLAVQRIALPLQVRPAYVETVPYTLIFATRRQDSLLCMNDAVCLHRRRLYEQSQRGVLGEEWFIQQMHQRREAEQHQLYLRILQQGRAQRSRRWPDLRQYLLLASFGQFTLQDYDNTLLQLLAEGHIRCDWRQHAISADGERIPGNDDTLVWIS